MNLFDTHKSADKYWPRIIYGLAALRITAWVLLISFCVICFEYSVAELNRLIRESRPHFESLSLDQTRDFLVVYLIFGLLYIFIDGEYVTMQAGCILLNCEVEGAQPLGVPAHCSIVDYIFTPKFATFNVSQ